MRALALLLLPSVALAIPTTMRQQGRLLDSNGEPVQGDVTLTFALHVDATTSATEWTEVHPNVPVEDGYYSVQLGGISDLDSAVFDGSDLWLSVSAAGGQIGGRSRIEATPYATRAAVSDAVDGYTLPAFSVFMTTDVLGLGTGWHKATQWSDTSTNAFDIGDNFANNEFTAPVDGLYFFTTSVRYDGTSGAYMRVIISRNDSTDYNSHPHAIDGNPSPNYQTMTTSGLMLLTAGDRVSVRMYSNGDGNWNLQRESSFSGYLVAQR